MKFLKNFMFDVFLKKNFGGAVLFEGSRGGNVHVTHSLRLTSGARNADLLVASMAAEPFSSTYL